MKVYLKPRSADPPQSLLDDCEMLSAFICRTLDAHPTMAPHEAMRTVQAQTERVFCFNWEGVWLVVEESCEPEKTAADRHKQTAATPNHPPAAVPSVQPSTAPTKPPGNPPA